MVVGKFECYKPGLVKSYKNLNEKIAKTKNVKRDENWITFKECGSRKWENKIISKSGANIFKTPLSVS